jgi:hypothetical protein
MEGEEEGKWRQDRKRVIRTAHSPCLWHCMCFMGLQKLRSPLRQVNRNQLEVRLRKLEQALLKLMLYQKLVKCCGETACLTDHQPFA